MLLHNISIHIKLGLLFDCQPIIVTIFITVLPRLLFDDWTLPDLKAFYTEPTSPQEQIALIEQVKKTCKQWKFDGIVLEILMQSGKFADAAFKFVQNFSKFFFFYFNWMLIYI